MDKAFFSHFLFSLGIAAFFPVSFPHSSRGFMSFLFCLKKGTLIRHLWPRMSDRGIGRGEWLAKGFPKRVLAMLTACETAP